MPKEMHFHGQVQVDLDSEDQRSQHLMQLRWLQRQLQKLLLLTDLRQLMCDWSVGCSGVWFENGEAAYPVAEITVAGNLIDIYARLIPGSDLELRGAANAPSLLVDGLAIAGK